MSMRQYDIETAFLNGDLEEHIELEQPKGFIEKSKNHIWKLQKSIYGLRQTMAHQIQVG